MLLINKLTVPGDIRRVELRLDTVRVKTRDGLDRLYKLVSTTTDDQARTQARANTSKEVSDGSIHRFPVRP